MLFWTSGRAVGAQGGGKPPFPTCKLTGPAFDIETTEIRTLLVQLLASRFSILQLIYPAWFKPKPGRFLAII
jgi:hypothetical protein